MSDRLTDVKTIKYLKYIAFNVLFKNKKRINWVVFSTPIWRLGNGVNIWNLLWLSKRLIICTEYTNIYINTFPNAFTSQMAKRYRDSYIFFAVYVTHRHNSEIQTALVSKRCKLLS